MNKEMYVNRIKSIRNSITDLVDELWSDPENKECFINRRKLEQQVVNDICYGYEVEEEN